MRSRLIIIWLPVVVAVLTLPDWFWFILNIVWAERPPLA